MAATEAGTDAKVEPTSTRGCTSAAAAAAVVARELPVTDEDGDDDDAAAAANVDTDALSGATIARLWDPAAAISTTTGAAEADGNTDDDDEDAEGMVRTTVLPAFDLATTDVLLRAPAPNETGVRRDRSTRSPTPNWPCEFLPHANNLPVLVSKRVW